MTLLIENIRKMMGWCPGVTPAKYNTIQHVDFVNPSQIPSGGSNVEKFESNNVMFFANTSVFTLFFVISVSLVLTLGWNLGYAVLIPILVIMYSLLYFLVIKMFQASISIDENGVHLKSFQLRDVVLNYKDIKSVTTFKLNKPSITLIAIALMILVAFLAHSVISGEWKLIVSIAPLLPWYLLVKHKQDREKYGLDTQLYIEPRKKKWYELSPYYSVITDQMTASGIQAAIEHYRGVK
ncbi:MAG: hypothetical protein C5S44_11605 [Candidatus Methanocomedens sp.]|nr:MAG: hypothetical protein C5S44_11605 [ANME-2 cluster archaeon]